MSCPAISESHVVVRVLRYDNHYSLFFEDASILSIPYTLLPEPKLGETVMITRSHEYGFVIKIVYESEELDLVHA